MPAGNPPPPSVGRIVHYFDVEGGNPIAAIIAEVIPAEGLGEQTLVGLHVFPPGEPATTIDNVAEHRGSGPIPARCWRWPERVG